MTDAYWTYRPLLDLIGFAEGTDKGDKYNETLAYGAYTGGDVSLVTMNLKQIDDLQTKMLNHPKNKWNSSAIGRYQIVRTTLRKIKSKLKVGNNQLFNEEFQDRCACFLLGGRGIDLYIAGKKSEDAMLTALAQEWASFPTPSGKGYYSGQGNKKVTPDLVRKTLREVKARTAQSAPVAETKQEDVLLEKSSEEKQPWWRIFFK